MSKKTKNQIDRPWSYPYEKASRKYIDPVMKKRFKIRYSTINAEFQIDYISENICYNVCVFLPSFPWLFVEDGRQMNSKRIKSKEISQELDLLEKEYNKLLSVGSLTKWMRECKAGEYDHYIVEGMKIIAEYLKEKVEE